MCVFTNHDISIVMGIKNIYKSNISQVGFWGGDISNYSYGPLPVISTYNPTLKNI